MALGIALLTVPLGQSGSWAKGPKRNGGPALRIVADRIVGFVPFTVVVYGKLTGVEPGRVELCRSEASPFAASDPAAVRGGPDGSTFPDRDAGAARCASGRMVRTAEGYDYTYDMRFDRPGTYQVQLMMVDRDGHRLMSNSVRVNAL